MLKKLLQSLSRGKVMKRRLYQEFGQIKLYVSPDARLQHIRFAGKGFDQKLLKIVS